MLCWDLQVLHIVLYIPGNMETFLGISRRQDNHKLLPTVAGREIVAAV
jgi:hypothetical protein